MTEEYEYEEDSQQTDNYSPFVKNIQPGLSELQDPDMARFYTEFIKPTNAQGLPYHKIEIDEDGKQRLKTQLIQMFTKELKTANLDGKDYAYVLDTFNFAIMMIDNGIIGQASMTLMHMIETRLMASNSKQGFLTKQMLSTVVNQTQKVEDATKRKLSFGRGR